MRIQVHEDDCTNIILVFIIGLLAVVPVFSLEIHGQLIYIYQMTFHYIYYRFIVRFSIGLDFLFITFLLQEC